MSKAEDEKTRERDIQILKTLERVEFMLQDFKHNHESGTFLLLYYYNKLPDDVIRRLSELDRETVELTANANPGIASTAIRKLNGSSALEQIVRAENHYRQHLGIAPIGPDSLSEKGTLNNGDSVQM